MKILITGGCGFVGTNLSLHLKKEKHDITTLDNLSRRGSKFNLNLLKKYKITNYRINIENYKKILELPKFDLIIDCCAEAAVEVSKKNIDKVINTNLVGTINILKKCKKDNSKLIFISSSRVYPIKDEAKNKFNSKQLFNEIKNISGPKTIYGVTKLASEMFIEEFSYAFNLKYIINRCGVLAGPLQFGKQDQGFVSLWIWRHFKKEKLKYIGYNGTGNQVRDVLHIKDFCELIVIQIKNFKKINNELFTIGGSNFSFTSLKNLTKICQIISGNKLNISKVKKKEKKTSIYDIPYFKMNNKKVAKTYNWKPKRNIKKIVIDTYNWMKNNHEDILKYFSN